MSAPSPIKPGGRFGCKIVDRDRAEIEPILERLLADVRPLEVGLYYGDPAAREHLFRLRPGARLPLTLHLDHRRLSLFDLHRQPELLHEQLGDAERLGATKVLTHVAAYPMTPRRERWQGLFEHLLPRFDTLASGCARRGLELLIENTFHGDGFYRALFDRLPGGAGFCLDIGHAKVWAHASLRGWLDFAEGLEAQGRRLHFHLHCNDGLADQHRAFSEAARAGQTAGDHFSGGQDYFSVLAALAARYPGSDKIFEVPPRLALENLDAVLAAVSERPPSPAGVH
jgi:hypothetical protein